MNLKKIIILHYCYGDERLCLFQGKLESLLKEYPDDTIVENSVVKRNVSPGE